VTVTLPGTRSRRRIGRTRQDRSIEVCLGGDALLAAVDEIAGLVMECAAPLTARQGWLQPMLEVAGSEVWAVLVRDTAGELTGAVVLVDRLDDLHPTLSLAGTEGGHRGVVLATDLLSAHALGSGVRDVLLSRRSLPRLALGPLPASDALVDAFARGLGVFEGTPADPIPVIRTDGTQDIAALLEHGVQRTLRKAANRLSADGRTTAVQVHVTAESVARLLPEIAAHHRERDHAHGRVSELDDARRRELWEMRLRALAETEQLEMTTLLIDGELAAYVLGVVDGDVYRLLEGRFVSRWARYSPGRQLEAAVVQRVLDDPMLSGLDWMTAVAPETLLGYNGADEMVTLEFPVPETS
jgi:Acetyltransferase (GNAT) domain